MKRFILCLLILISLQTQALASENSLLCIEKDNKIFCRFSLRSFITKIEHILSNGWQNTLTFDFYLLDKNNQVLLKSSIAATQRCYIDPFESPCLLLWSGADQWLRYEGQTELFSALAGLRIQALSLPTLQPDDYTVRVIINLNPITDKQISELQTWFKRSGHYRALPFGNNNTSLLGSFLTTFAEFAPGNAEASIKLQTSPFFISTTQSQGPEPGPQ